MRNLAGARYLVRELIEATRRQGLELDELAVANQLVPEGPLADDDPRCATALDPWSVAWHLAHDELVP